MKTMKVTYCDATVTVNVPEKIAAQLRKCGDVNRGRFAYVAAHVSGTAGEKGCITPRVTNITFCRNPRYDLFLTRNREAIAAVTPFTDRASMITAGVKQALADKIMEKTNDIPATFTAAQAAMLASIDKSIAGDTSDGYRLAARECFAHRKGWRLNLVTADNEDGHKRPVVDTDGRMTVRSIMLPFFEVRRDIVVRGEWKPVNSGAPKLMKDAIEDVAGVPEWKAFSLTLENFTSLTLDAKTIYGAIPDKSTRAFDTAIAAICGLQCLPLEALRQDADNSVGMPVEDDNDIETEVPAGSNVVTA